MITHGRLRPQHKLEALPEGSKLALRDISLTFPVGLADVCRQALQVLSDRLLEGSDTGVVSKKSTQRENTAYINVMSLLVTAREPLPITAFGSSCNEGLFSELCGTIDISEDSAVSLHHRSVVEWVISDNSSPSLRVTVPTARQVIADAVMEWLAPLLATDHQLHDHNGGTSVDERLTKYAVKHAVYHLTDVGNKQADNVARVLCSLHYVQQKLKLMTSGIPAGVAVRYLLDDYEHSHLQETLGSSTVKKVTLSSMLKRSSGLTEQVDLMKQFITRRAKALSQVGAQYTLHVAANYPSVSRIQDNARVDLGASPWLEHITAVADTPALKHGGLRGVVVDLDVAPDQKQLALVTRVDDGEDTTALLYLISTSDNLVPDPVDIGKLVDRTGLSARYMPAPGAGGAAVFIGSLRQFVAVRGGRPVDSGLDVASLKLSERYSIECSAVRGTTLAVGLSTLPWGGRSLHLAIFDLQSRKCQRTIEALKFRFGGSAQFGVKAVGLSSDAQVVCACLKQSKMKVSTWNTSSGEQLSSTDVDDDGLTKCLVVGPSTQPTVVLSAGARSGSSSKRRLRCYVWSWKDSTARLMAPDCRYDFSLAHVTGQTAVVAQCRRDASTTLINYWSKADFTEAPDRKYSVHCPDDDVIEVATTDRLVALFSASHFSIYAFHDLQTINSDHSDTFVADQATVDAIGFMPRSDDPVVAYSVDKGLNQAVCSLHARSGEAPVFGTPLFDPVTTSGCDPRKLEPAGRVFPVPARCAYLADASCALVVDTDSVRTRDLASSIVASLPVHDKMADIDSDNNCTAGNILLFAVSPKDTHIGLVYRDSEHTIRLFDVKTPAKPVLALSDNQAGLVTDFSFLPASGHVVSYHRKSEGEETLITWNQKSGTLINRDASAIGVGYIRLSPASDRIALSMRSNTGSSMAALILRSSDNRFNVSLSTPVSWAAERHSSDVEFSPDGTVLVGFCSTSGCAWNAGSGEPLRTFDVKCSSPEVVGWPSNIHVLLHDSSNERLLIYDVISGLAIAAAVTEGRVDGKWSERRFRVSPRGGVVAGSTVHGELRVYACRNMASVRRQTSLQAIRATTGGVTSPK